MLRGSIATVRTVGLREAKLDAAARPGFGAPGWFDSDLSFSAAHPESCGVLPLISAARSSRFRRLATSRRCRRRCGGATRAGAAKVRRMPALAALAMRGLLRMAKRQKSL